MFIYRKSKLYVKKKDFFKNLDKTFGFKKQTYIFFVSLAMGFVYVLVKYDDMFYLTQTEVKHIVVDVG